MVTTVTGVIGVGDGCDGSGTLGTGGRRGRVGLLASISIFALKGEAMTFVAATDVEFDLGVRSGVRT
ncbi:hypothetical protein [Streptosporangium canum]|uniref:hypothetical protein n=1 Tax=Streptosporangium canum TaxID=324952 RepID=UPI0037A32C01